MLTSRRLLDSGFADRARDVANVNVSDNPILKAYEGLFRRHDLMQYCFLSDAHLYGHLTFHYPPAGYLWTMTLSDPMSGQSCPTG